MYSFLIHLFLFFGGIQNLAPSPGPECAAHAVGHGSGVKE